MGLNEEVEARIRACFDREDYAGAVSEALKSYGPDVYRFLCLRVGAEDQADEVFGQLCEDIWKGVSKFRWKSAFSTWMYTLARNSASRYQRSPANQARRHLGLSQQMEKLVADVRTSTLPYLRSSVKDRFGMLRQRLDPDDRTLLLLRVNQEMSWNDVARVMENDPELDGPELVRASARMRQRFQKVKDTLRRLAEDEGLIGDDES